MRDSLAGCIEQFATFVTEGTLQTITTIGIAVLCAAGCWGAESLTPLDVKLGLWETKTQHQMGGMGNVPALPAIPPETLAKMPPEQRARVEAMMKGRAAGALGGMITKTCITREQLDNPMAFSRGDHSCTQKVISSSSSRWQVRIDCNENSHKMTGNLTVERIDSTHIKGNMVAKGGMEEHPVDMKMSFESTWLSTDCGKVKPERGQ